MDKEAAVKVPVNNTNSDTICSENENKKETVGIDNSSLKKNNRKLDKENNEQVDKTETDDKLKIVDFIDGDDAPKLQISPIDKSKEGLEVDQSNIIEDLPPAIDRDIDFSCQSENEDDLITLLETSSANGGAVLIRKDSYQFCRICHEVGSEEVFISPCKCKGSVSWVHKWCLERWLAESDTNFCELCGFVFNIERKPKYNVLWSVGLWLLYAAPIRERRLLICDIVLLLALFPFATLTTMIAFRIARSVFVADINERVVDLQVKLGLPADRDDVQLITTLLARLIEMMIYSFIILLDVATVYWTMLRTKYHVSRWYRWYRRNCKVLLNNYAEMNKSNRPVIESVTSARALSF